MSKQRTFDFEITLSDESAAYWYQRLFGDVMNGVQYPLPPAPSNRLVIAYAFRLEGLPLTSDAVMVEDTYGVVAAIYMDRFYINGKHIVSIMGLTR